MLPSVAYGDSSPQRRGAKGVSLGLRPMSLREIEPPEAVLIDAVDLRVEPLYTTFLDGDADIILREQA